MAGHRTQNLPLHRSRDRRAVGAGRQPVRARMQHAPRLAEVVQQVTATHEENQQACRPARRPAPGGARCGSELDPLH